MSLSENSIARFGGIARLYGVEARENSPKLVSL